MKTLGNMPWFKFYASDFLAGVAGLSAAERGVLITILALIYEAGDPVPSNERRLARICGLPPAGFRKAFAALIEQGKLVVDADTITNRRAEKEIMERHQRSQKARSSANQRWTTEVEKVVEYEEPSDAIACQSQCDPNAMPETRDQKPEKDRNRSSAVPAEVGNAYIDDELLDRVIAAADLPAGPRTSHWKPPLATRHVARWRTELGLTAEEILEAIERNRPQYDLAPDGPKAFDGMLKRLAAQKSAPPMIPEVSSKRGRSKQTGKTTTERAARFDAIR